MDKHCWFRHLITNSLVAVIIVLSFRSFAAYLTPRLNSDHAVHVLMAEHLKLPDDLYYWGQDRLGSIIPILGHFLLKILPISPVEAVSYVQYLLLLTGFFYFASLLKQPISKLILALIWFLPMRYFVPLLMIGQPYSAQLCFTAIAIVCIRSLLMNRENDRGWKRQVYIAIATACLFVGLWISDLTIIILFLIGAMALRHAYWFNQRSDISQGEKRRAIVLDGATIGTVSLLGMLFISYAKNHATVRTRHLAFSSIPEIFEVITKLATSFVQTLLFQGDNLFLSLQAIFSILFVSYAIWLINKHRTDQSIQLSEWFYLFLLHTILGFGLLICSHWLYINDISLRYFVVVYITGWFSALLFVEALNQPDFKWVYGLLIAAACTSSLSLPPYVFAIEKAQPTIQRLQAFATLGKVGIIGEYWSSYVLCSVNPAQLNCTPRDDEGSIPCLPVGQSQQSVTPVRCSRCVSEVLESETIYLVKNKWLKTFPDQIQQFNQCLIKVGEPRKIWRYAIAPYQKL